MVTKNNIIVNGLKIDLSDKTDDFKKIIAEYSFAPQKSEIKKDVGNYNVKLCNWKDEKFGIPVLIPRSGLFSVSKNLESGHHSKEFEIVSSSSLYQIHRRGFDLNQDCLDILLVLFSLAKNKDISNPLVFKISDVLRELSKGKNPSLYNFVKLNLFYLYSTDIKIQFNVKRTYFNIEEKREIEHKEDIRVEGKFIRYLGQDKDGNIVVQFEFYLIKQLLKTGLILFNKKDREILKRNFLAKWLHLFYATHKEAEPFEIKTLRRYSGSKYKEIIDFKRMLGNSLLRIKEDVMEGIEFFDKKKFDEGDTIVFRKNKKTNTQYRIVSNYILPKTAMNIKSNYQVFRPHDFLRYIKMYSETGVKTISYSESGEQKTSFSDHYVKKPNISNIPAKPNISDIPAKPNISDIPAKPLKLAERRLGLPAGDEDDVAF